MSRFVDCDINDDEAVERVAGALSSKVRRSIIRILNTKSYTMIELASILKIPVSNMSFHIKELEKAQLVNVTVKDNSRGNAKVVSRKADRVNIGLFYEETERQKLIQTDTINIPIGSFTHSKVQAGCGIASEQEIIVSDDEPSVFFAPERYKAQIVWFSKGYVEYKVPTYAFKGRTIKRINISVEMCSEAPNYRNDWKSDITFWINDKEVVTYVSPGDFGGRRGRLNPSWWSSLSTQYGIMKNILITEDGTFIDNESASGYRIKHLNINGDDFFTIRIGVKEDAKNQGGVNLFGEKFGDYNQNLLINVESELKA